MQQYYTLEQAAQILRISPEQLKEMARKKEIRAFQDRSGWRFRAQEIDEMARARGFGSDPELPLGEAVKAKSGDSDGSDEVFQFRLDVDDSDEVPLGKQPASAEKPSPSGSGSGSRKASGPKSPPKAASDSDVRLVLEGSDVNFAIETGSQAPAVQAPVSPAPKVGSSKSRKAPPVQDESGVRMASQDQPTDSDVKIEPSSPHDSKVPTVGKEPTKKASDSDIRIEEVGVSGKVDPNLTEEIDLDAEARKAEEARAKTARPRPKPPSSPALPTKSPFELSESDLDMDAPQPTGADTDSSSDFELQPLSDSSSPIEVSSDEMPAIQSDDEVGLGQMTGGKGATGINLQEPADSGISLEPRSSDEMELDLTLESGPSTPKPAAGKTETDSSSDFELSVDEGSSSPTEGSSSEFELSLQEEDASPTEGSSSEFELSLDAEGSDLVVEPQASDSDSEFELTLDEGGGLSGEQEESGSEVVALDEGETEAESSEFDLSLEGEESGSQVVPLEEEEEFDESAATVQRKVGGELVEEEEGELDEALDEDLEEAPAAEEEVEAAVAPAAAAPPADWGVVVPLASLLTTVLLFIVSLMSFELIQGMWGYYTGNKVSNLIIYPIAKIVSGEDKLPEN